MSSYYPAVFAGVYAVIVVIVLGLQVGLSFIGASMAKRKGYSFGGFWCLGFFSSFLIGIIAAAIVPDLNLYVRKDELYAYAAVPPVPAARPCPACGKPVAVGDLFCSACGSKMP
ncbi:MAG: zinc ribbon domain-containing protein [Christensenellales bacterium]|jgi:hypothetical protein